jgi:hypothetical protein
MNDAAINRSGTVADISDAALVERAVRSAVSEMKKKRHPYAWVAIQETFGLGSTYSAQLCLRFNIDPDTGLNIVEASNKEPK